jgi:hypothetical protein
MPELAAVTINLGEILILAAGTFGGFGTDPNGCLHRGLFEDPGPVAIFSPIVYPIVQIDSKPIAYIVGSIVGRCLATALSPPCLSEGGVAVLLGFKQTDMIAGPIVVGISLLTIYVANKATPGDPSQEFMNKQFSAVE